MQKFCYSGQHLNVYVRVNRESSQESYDMEGGGGGGTIHWGKPSY